MALDGQLASTIVALAGTVNASEFDVYSAGELIFAIPANCGLFEGATVTGEYNFESGKWYYRISEKYSVRQHSWLEVWRDPVQATNSDGTPILDSGGKPTYTGAGIWDSTDPPLYVAADWSGLVPTP
jgi:hypothetical protein